MINLDEVIDGFREEEYDQLKKLIEYVHGVDANAIKTMDYSDVLKIERKIHDITDIIDKCKEYRRFIVYMGCEKNEEKFVSKMSGTFYRD